MPLGKCEDCGYINVVNKGSKDCEKCNGKREDDIESRNDGSDKQTNSKIIEVSTHKGNSTQFQPVIIEDIKMPFPSMIIFMVKWAIASIPAIIILFLIWMMVMGLFGVGIATLFK